MPRHLRTHSMISLAAALALAGSAIATNGAVMAPSATTPAPQASFTPAKVIAVQSSGRAVMPLTCPEQGTGQCSTSGTITVGGKVVSRLRGAIIEGGQTIRVNLILRGLDHGATARRATVRLTTMRGTGTVRSTQTIQLLIAAAHTPAVAG